MNPSPAKWEESAERILMDYADGAESFATSMNKIHQLLSDYKSRLLSEVEVKIPKIHTGDNAFNRVPKY